MGSDDRACPLCGAASSYALTARDRNWEITDERFTYNRCSACATVFMVDVPDDMARYYGGEYHSFAPDGEPPWGRDAGLQEAESFRVRLLRRHVADGPLVDIGAGAGGFASAAKAGGYDVTAIEMDARCCDYLEQQVGVRAICSADPRGSLEQLQPASVITLWHVLEHLPEPRELLGAAAQRLRPGGVLALGVPNPDSLQFRVLGARWPHLDAPRHLSLMPADALVEVARELGLRCVERTTNDPSGLACNVHGWAFAMRRRPASGPPAMPAVLAGRALATVTAPIERSDLRGAAVTLLLQRNGGP